MIIMNGIRTPKAGKAEDFRRKGECITCWQGGDTSAGVANMWIMEAMCQEAEIFLKRSIIGGGNMREMREDMREMREDTPEMCEDTPEMREDVSEMREDAPEMCEDAPEMREDVSEMREDAPEMREDTREKRGNTPEMHSNLPEMRKKNCIKRKGIRDVKERAGTAHACGRYSGQLRLKSATGTGFVGRG